MPASPFSPEEHTAIVAMLHRAIDNLTSIEKVSINNGTRRVELQVPIHRWVRADTGERTIIIHGFGYVNPDEIAVPDSPGRGVDNEVQSVEPTADSIGGNNDASAGPPAGAEWVEDPNTGWGDWVLPDGTILRADDDEPFLFDGSQAER